MDPASAGLFTYSSPMSLDPNPTCTITELRREAERLNAELSIVNQQLVETNQKLVRSKRTCTKANESLVKLLIHTSKEERKAASADANRCCLKYGTPRLVMEGHNTWYDGPRLKEVNESFKKNSELLEVLEKAPLKDIAWLARFRNTDQENTRLQGLIEKYERKKKQLKMDLKRIQYEDNSVYNNFRVLAHSQKDRFIILNLLGKGGFGEVYKAYDLEEYCYVTVKFLFVSSHLTPDDQMAFVNCCKNETLVQAQLQNRHVVRQFMSFLLNPDTMCLILEYCAGNSLAAYTRKKGLLPEWEAKLIIVQVFQALHYISSTRDQTGHTVIHYDIKPDNVLFDEDGVVKLAYFGLSKLNQNKRQSGEATLTVPQGVGTLRYLPPECFAEENQKILISSKVDVWSAGIMFYQLLYGRIPFNPNQTNEQIYHQRTSFPQSYDVHFPDTPPNVSNEAKV